MSFFGRIDKKQALYATLLLVLVVYIRTLFFDFVNFDDGAFIYENFRIINFNFHNLKWYFFNYLNGHYFPLTMLSYGLQSLIWGISPLPFHAFNLVLHLINCYLVYRLLNQLKVNNFSTWFIVALFGLHPIQVESVVWVGTRGGILSSFFTLLSISSFINYLEQFKVRDIIISFLLFCLAVLSKSAALVVPVLFLLIEFKRSRPYNREAILEKIPFFLVSFIIGLVAVNAAKDLGTVSEGLAEEGGYTVFKIKIFKVLYSLSYYFNHLLFPTNQTSMHFDPQVIDGMLPIKYYFSFIPLFLTVTWITIKEKNLKEIVFWGGFYFVTLALVVNILPLGGTIVSERYAYLNILAGGFLISKVLNIIPLKQIRNIVSILLVVVFSVVTFFSTSIWENSLNLHKRSFDLFPGSVHAAASYSRALGNNGQVEEALKIQKSNPTFLESPDFLANIAHTYFTLDSVDKRDEYLEKAIKKDPSNTFYYFKKAAFNIGEKNYTAAIKNLNISIDLDPNNFFARKRRALVYFLIEDYGKCCQDWRFLYDNGDKSVEQNIKEFCLNTEQPSTKLDTNKVFKAEGFKLEVLKDTVNGDSVLHLFKYDSLGRLSEKGQINNGKYDGRIMWYYPSGNLMRVGYYFDSFPFGQWKKYYESGNLKAIYDHESGVKHGSYKYYYENGNLWTEKIYAHGKLENVKQLLTKDGKKLEIGTLKDGKGTLFIYDENGKRESVAEYQEGYLKNLK